MKIKKNILTNYCNYTMKIPNWVQTTNRVHKKIWDEMGNINDGLKNLFIDAILTDYKLNRIHMNINHHIEVIEEILIEFNEDLGEEIELYYVDLFEYLIEEAVYDEKFEIASNLKKYKDVYVR